MNASCNSDVDEMPYKLTTLHATGNNKVWNTTTPGIVVKELMYNDSGALYPTDIVSYNEVDIMSKVRHPHILNIKEVFVAPSTLYGRDTVFYAMEKCDHTLDQYIRLGVTIEQKDILVGELLGTISYLYSIGVHHCDLKPNNVMIKDGHIKLIDFGNAQYSFIQSVKECGTHSCIPPELLYKHCYPFMKKYMDKIPSITNKPSFITAEAWSIGLIIYFISTGEYYTDPNKTTGIIPLLDDPDTYHKDKMVKVPGKWRDLVDGLLHLDNTKRLILLTPRIPFVPNDQDIDDNIRKLCRKCSPYTLHHASALYKRVNNIAKKKNIIAMACVFIVRNMTEGDLVFLEDFTSDEKALNRMVLDIIYHTKGVLIPL